MPCSPRRPCPATPSIGHGERRPDVFKPGRNQIVIVRAALLQPLYLSFPVNFMGSNMDSQLKTAGSNNARLIMSTVAFMNEPFAPGP